MTWFETITEKTLPWKVAYASWCPEMDLCVFAVENPAGMACFRLNGEKVWQVPVRRDSRVQQICWQDDGNAFCVVYADGLTQVHQTANGRPAGTPVPGSVTAVAWASSGANGAPEAGNETQLTSQFTRKDLAKMLPRLPPLVQAKDAMGVMTAIEQTGDSEHALTVQAWGTRGGALGLNLYSVFPVGDVELGNGAVRHLAVGPDLASYYGILESDDTLRLHAAKGGFVSKFGPNYLPEVSLVPAHALALVDYVAKAIAAADAERAVVARQTTSFLAPLQRWASGDLPQDTAPETSESLAGRSAQTALFEFVVTGRVDAAATSWLEETHEKGLRRWSKAAGAAYESVRTSLFEQVVPALTKALVLLSRLHGLAQWQQRGAALGLAPGDVAAAIDAAENVLKTATRAAWALSNEIDAFRAFTAWADYYFETALGRSMNGSGNVAVTSDVLRYITDFLPDRVFKDTDIASLAQSVAQLRKTSLGAFSNAKAAIRGLVAPSYAVSLGPHSATTRLTVVDGAPIALLTSTDSSTVVLCKMALDGTPLAACIDCTALIAPKTTVVQAEFVQGNILLLLGTDSKHAVASVPLSAIDLHAIDVPSDSTVYDVIGKTDSTPITTDTIRELDAAFSPAQMAVNPSRKVAVLLHKDRQRYIFFDIANDNDDDDDDDGNDE